MTTRAFDWTNDEWALAFLPPIRLATLHLAHDDKTLEELMSALAKAGAVPEVFESWAQTRDELRALIELLDAALARSVVALERLGYSPDNPPPETTLQ
jgi:hypothetical protein